MKYAELVKIYEKLEKTSGRLDKVEILSKFLKKCKELKDVVYLIQGRVFSKVDDRKIGMSSRLILKVIANTVGVGVNEVEKEWRRKGDLGKVTEEMLKNKKQVTLAFKSLTVKKVVDNIRKLSALEGSGSVGRKVGLISELLNNAKPEEGKFIVRTVLEDLRIGVAEGVLRDSISKAFDVEDVEKAYNVLVDYGEVAERSKKGKLDEVGVEIGKPVKVMLAILVKDVKEGFKAVGETALFEEKVDGFRVQVHYGKEIKLFTRRMEDVSKQFPDVIEVVKKNVKKDVILDCEVVGISNGRHLPFQKISQRIKRKHDIIEMSKKFPVELNVFDILYYKKSLMDVKLKERREVLKKVVKESDKIRIIKSLITNDEKKAVKFFKESLKNGLEGLMIKNLDSEYKPGRYVDGWVKLKGVLEPLDLVIVGGEYGKGKRVGWLSSFDLACKDGDELLEVGKVGTGIKEKSEGVTFKALTDELEKDVVEEKGNKVKVKPRIVLEVGYEEIQKSVNYDSGYGLRFPKVMSIREDKDVSEISDLKLVKKIYDGQRGKK